MRLWALVGLVLLFGALSICFALCLTFLAHVVAWIFNLGRKTAKHNPWR